MKILNIAVGACFFFIASGVIAQNVSLSNNALGTSMDRRLLEQEVAPIRSRAELQEYLKFMPAQSPLKYLSPSNRERFLNSLVFSESGLASYSYQDLEMELNALEAYKVLSLFGQQATVALIPGLRQSDGFSKAIMSSVDSREPVNAISGEYRPDASKDPDYPDYPDYACVAKATCGQSMGKICIGANC
ncbi:hypothetical protein EIQ06_14985 [Xanthomonas campestris pv. campestris]|uniref:hypothetical protein n=1 Tax=Xanthomonas campestris TaxID=339 RepID=UPI00094ABE5E|nr:hypothetical protein [Xanthomonas campestris]MDO0844162.1 hypothetical protein [Xanthomonas campestris pv. campestris]MEA0625394.1 hypothetical protein [Xanthomonas campestris pv. campestris]MEA0667700.1 hypothetical protein [Xanthomonas campestris pv. campestris]MEA0675851.1 hypothetical protein [Xanthomonas campestris pv. campestris]MEA0696586.1 hypothetical protein [Xanthomonas campestris pv. campestris]